MNENDQFIRFSDMVELNPREDISNGMIPYIGMSDVTNHGGIERVRMRPASEVATGQSRFRDGDILFAKITPCMENGKGAFVAGLNSHAGAGSTEFHVLRARPNVFPRFIYHWTCARDFRRCAESMMTGSAGQRRVSPSFFGNIGVRRRTLPEQQRIADVLDAVLAEEHAIEASMEKLSSLRQSALLEEFAPIRRSVLPAGWSRTPLKNVVPKAEYGISEALDRDQRGVPVLRMNNLEGGRVELSDLRYCPVAVRAKLELRYGDVLFNRTNSIDHIGKAAMWREELFKATFASYLVRINPDSRHLLPEYLIEWLMHPLVRQRVRSISTVAVQQVNVNPSRLRDLEIEMPLNVQDQRRIVDSLYSYDQQIESEWAELHKVRTIKMGLTDDLLGKVRRPNPAS